MRKMLFHLIMRRVKRMWPLVLILVTLCILFWHKSLIEFHDAQSDQMGTSDKKYRDRRVDNEIGYNDKPQKIWMIVETQDSHDCFTLAAHFQDWNIVLTDAVDNNIRHSRCHFIGNSTISNLCREYGITCTDDSKDNRINIAVLYILKFHPNAVYIPPVVKGIKNIEKPTVTQIDIEQKIYKSLVYISNNLNSFSESGHFGCNVNHSANISYKGYKLCNVPQAAVQASVTILGKSTTICDFQAPKVVLNQGQYSQYSVKGTFFLHDAFWAIGMMHAYAYTDLEIQALTAASQKLLWLTGNNLKVTSLVFRNKSADKSSFIHVLQKLDKWKCKSSNDFKECMQSIIDYMHIKNMIRTKTAEDIKMWVTALSSAGYKFPKINILKNNLSCDKAVNFVPVIYTESTSNHSISKVRYPINNIAATQTTYNKVCVSDQRGDSTQHVNLAQPWVQFYDILLIVVFNKPHYEAVPYVEMLYAGFFTHILYCGPDYPSSHNVSYLFTQSAELSRSFVSYGGTAKGHFPGSFNYVCFNMAFEMNYNVKGYFMIADDNLIWIHKISKFPKDMVWYVPQKEIRTADLKILKECRLGMCDFYPHWNWWEDYRNATINVLNYMKLSVNSSDVISNCYNQLINLNAGEYKANGAYSDVYYIPQRLASSFAYLSKLFLDYGVFLEIAVPTILRCLEDPADIQPLEGVQNWDIETRNMPWIYFDQKHILGKAYYHPVKWGFMYDNTTFRQYRNFLCNKVLPLLYDPYQRVSNLLK